MNSDIKKSSTFWTNIFKTSQDKNDLETLISNMPVFKNIGSRATRLVLNIVHHRIYDAGENIFLQGDPGIGFYIIQEGTVKIMQADNNGDEREIAEFKRGDFFGDMALFDNEIRSASAVAVTETKLAVIFKPDLDSFIEKYPEKGIIILRGISQIIASRLRILNKEHSDLYNQYIKILKEDNYGTDKENISTG